MASKYKGYTGKVIKIDLNTRSVEEYPFSDRDRELYLGGKIMAAKIISDFISGPIDPLSDKNVVVISTGPLNALNCPSSSRFNISTISPLTNLLTSSNCGGSFGIHLKRAGYDAAIITGKSEEKLLLEITEDGVNFKNADNLWGLHATPAQEAIPGNNNIGKLVIGPAGENLVRYACLVSQERVAGRGGVGAVFGSKNIKAVTAKGSKMPEAYNKDKLLELNKKWVKRLRSHPLTGKQMPRLGTAGLVSMMQARNLLSTKNFSRGKYDDFKMVSGEELAANHLVRNKGCITCPIQCARVVKVKGKDVKGPELETLGLLGPNILNNNIQLIFDWNYEIDELGMDTISTAGTIAFTMELTEKGKLNSELEFGKTDNISKIIEDIAYRRGLGDEMANGSKWMSYKYGGEEFAMHSKGMELAAYEPRAAYGQGLGYATSNRGGCHLNAGYMVVLEGLGLTINQYTRAGKANLSVMFQNLMEAASAGGSCLFTTYAFFPFFLISKPNSIVTRIVNLAMPYTGPVLFFANKFPKMLAVNITAMLPHPVAINHATGMKLNFGKFMSIGERGYNLERHINNKLGVSVLDDTLPKRSTEEYQIPGNKKSRVPLDKMRKSYYHVRGWDKHGIVKKGKLKALKLDKIYSE
jgi:aldehyde:ferredoxin oxidoreductase